MSSWLTKQITNQKSCSWYKPTTDMHCHAIVIAQNCRKCTLQRIHEFSGPFGSEIRRICVRSTVMRPNKSNDYWSLQWKKIFTYTWHHVTYRCWVQNLQIKPGVNKLQNAVFPFHNHYCNDNQGPMINSIDVINVYKRFLQKKNKKRVFNVFILSTFFLFSARENHSRYFFWLQQDWQRINY